MTVTNMMKKLIVLFVILAVMPLCANTAFANIPAAYVGGQVYSTNTNGGSLDYLDVQVNCTNGTYMGQLSPVVQTGGGGHYSTYLICGMGDEVEVTVSDGGNELGSNTGIVDYQVTIGGPGSEVDVGFAHVVVGIPEFSAAVIPLFLTMLSFGLVGKRLF